MRVTTQMLSEQAQKAGLNFKSTTLLDYINDDSTTTSNSLLTALNNAKQKTSYEEIGKAATALEETAAAFVSEQEDNLFAKAKEDGSTKAIKEQTEKLVENYNAVMKKLETSTSALDSFYRKAIADVYTENKDSLESIGISADKNGYLSLEESKFDAADLETLEKVLGTGSTFTTKVGYIASRVADNAETGLDNLSSQYSVTGQSYSTYLSNKYNLLG